MGMRTRTYTSRQLTCFVLPPRAQCMGTRGLLAYPVQNWKKRSFKLRRHIHFDKKLYDFRKNRLPTWHRYLCEFCLLRQLRRSHQVAGKEWHYPFTACWSRDAPPVLHSTVRYAYTVFMCSVFIWEQTATCATYSINWLVFITEMKRVYSAVLTGSLNKAVCTSFLKGS
jgi:hypothetical protein